MKQIVVLFILVLIPVSGFEQSSQNSKRAVVLELAGSGGLGSVNFEKLFLKKRKIDLIWRLGFSLAPVDPNNGVGLVFPIMGSALIGKFAHKLELGVGQGLTITTKGSVFAMGLAALGYRYQRHDSMWFFKAAYTPLISYLVNFQVQQWFGFGVGYTFKKR